MSRDAGSSELYVSRLFFCEPRREFELDPFQRVFFRIKALDVLGEPVKLRQLRLLASTARALKRTCLGKLYENLKSC
jgi:hypothetical protein